VLVVHDLERERGERRVVGRLPLFERPRLRIDALDRRDVERRRQVVDDRVEQRLDTLVLEGRAADDGEEPHRDRPLADGRLELRGADGRARDVLLHEVLVHLGEPLDHLLPVLVDERGEVGGDRGLRVLLAQRLVVFLPDERDLVDQVDEPSVLVLTTDGDLDGHRVGTESALEHLDAAEVVGPDAIHLVDVDEPGDTILVRLAPHGLGLRLHARHRVEDGDGAVEHA